MKTIFAYLLFAAGLLLTTASPAAAQDPASLVRSVDAALSGQPVSEAETVVGRDFDQDGLARSIVGPRWNEATDDEKRRLRAAIGGNLARMLASTYAAFQDAVLRIAPIRAPTLPQRVQSWLQNADGRSVEMTWLVCQRGGALRVCDVSVDAVSYVASMRSQLAELIAAHGLGGVLTRLEESNGR